MWFQLQGEISAIELIAVGGSIREEPRLEDAYGPGRWRKLKGVGRVLLPHGASVLAELHWYEAPWNRPKGNEDQKGSLMVDASPDSFVLCVRTSEYAASLEARKIYRTVPDVEAGKRSLLRVIDESGEDYLYPAEIFVPISVPKEAEPAFATRVR